jgi:hypothetical protein
MPETKKNAVFMLTACFLSKMEFFSVYRPNTALAGIIECTRGGVIMIIDPAVGCTYIGRAYMYPGFMAMVCIGNPCWVFGPNG